MTQLQIETCQSLISYKLCMVLVCINSHEYSTRNARLRNIKIYRVFRIPEYTDLVRACVCECVRTYIQYHVFILVLEALSDKSG